MKLRRLVQLGVLPAAVLLAGLLSRGGAEDAKSAPPAQPAAPGAQPAPAASPAKAAEAPPAQDPAKGALSGRITFEGPLPELPPKAVPAGHQDHAACAQHVKEERLILSEKKELKDVVVSVAGYKPAEKPKPREIGLTNKNCTYIPHVQATTVGSRLKVTNEDAFIHNFHSLLALQKNIAIGPGQSTEEKLPRDGWVNVICDYHTWMGAHIKVFAHDLFAVTGADGAYSIPNIPPGEYEIELWHEFPVQTVKQKVKIEAGKATQLDVALKATPKK